MTTLPMNRRSFLGTTSLASTALLMQPARSMANQTSRPNVIVIMTDDQGYGDFGVTGNPVIQTPHIDAMAERSATLDNFYVSPVCTPTRACLMTGRYNYRTRAIDTYVGRAMMEPAETTIAELLKQSGYATGIFGKWHLGDNYPLRAQDQGFERALVHRGGGIGQPADPPGGEGKYTDAILFDQGEAVQTEGYCTDVYFDEAIQWIDEKKDQKQPFFAYIPTNAPHGPFHDVPDEWLEYYKAQDLAQVLLPGQEVGEQEIDRIARIFAMISNIDENVGKLFGYLHSAELTENTIVIFLNDNGPAGTRYNAGYRGTKSGVHEGGIRTPIFIHWPGTLEAGHSSDRIAAHIDLAPTILEACGVGVDDDLHMDGKSLLPLLKDDDVEWEDRTIFIQAHRGNEPVLYHHFAARNQRWKLLHASGFGRETFEGEPKFELYDLQNDPYESTDLASERSDILSDMRKQYEDWFADVSSTRPDNYAPPRIHIGTPHENPVVLTRQDWRHIKGRKWAGNSNGYWLLHAPDNGTFDIRLRFPEVEAVWNIELDINGTTYQQSVSSGMAECVFDSVEIARGDVRLHATMDSDSDSKGPWQVDVIHND